jgi:hypothetical protein
MPRVDAAHNAQAVAENENMTAQLSGMFDRLNMGPQVQARQQTRREQRAARSFGTELRPNNLEPASSVMIGGRIPPQGGRQ